MWYLYQVFSRSLIRHDSFQYPILKKVILAVFGGVNLLSLVYAIAAGTQWFSAKPLIYPFWIIVVSIFQIFPYVLSFDIGQRMLKRFFSAFAAKTSRAQSFILWMVPLVLAIYIPFRINYDLNHIDVQEVVVEKEGLPEELEDLKVVLISDIQMDEYTEKADVLRYIAKVNALEPDLVLIAGDFITNTSLYIEPVCVLLQQLTATHGVYACVGDHDHWAYPGGEPTYARSVRDIAMNLRRSSIPLLENENKVIRIGSSRIKLTATNETYASSVSDELLSYLIQDEGPYDLKLFINHQPRPRLINRAAEANYDLFLAGHTHGGQLVFYFPFLSVNPAMFDGSPYIRGMHQLKELVIVICHGLGVSVAPIRYNATPNVVSVRLQKKTLP